MSYGLQQNVCSYDFEPIRLALYRLRVCRSMCLTPSGTVLTLRTKQLTCKREGSNLLMGYWVKRIRLASYRLRVRCLSVADWRRGDNINHFLELVHIYITVYMRGSGRGRTS